MGVNPRSIRILNKLASYGADTEKKITALTYPDIMKICKESKTLAFQDMESIIRLQEDIKARRVIPFMLGITSQDDEVDQSDNNKNKKELRRKDILKSEEEAENAKTSEKEEGSVAGRQLYSRSGEFGRTEGIY